MPFPQLARDLAAHQLPDFSLLIPNLRDDMHDCPVATGDAWRRAHVVPLLHSPELLALGPVVRHGSRFSKATNHYGLLRTIEDAWRLPRLGYSSKGTPIGGICK